MSIASARAQFQQVIETILSAQEYRIRTASGAWLTLAGAGEQESAALTATARGAAAETGVGLRELSERLVEMSDFTANTAALAQQVSAQLQRAGDRTAQAVQAALQLQQRFNELVAQQRRGSTSAHAAQALEGEIMALTAEAQQVLTGLDQEYANIVAGEAPPAPRSGGPGGPAAAPTAPTAATPTAAGPSAASAASAAASGPAGTASASAAAADQQAPNGAAVGAGEYPASSVLGPEQGDFAGWTRDPNTGYLVDPATGREFDPASGRWIDPVTGKPFGDVTEYATRLSGLGGGAGGIASPSGLAMVGGGGIGGGTGSTGLAGLYGGVLPPSIAGAGAIGGQMVGQAMTNLNNRAHVATQLAMREAAQGGRPFMPPPAMAGAAAGGAQGRGTQGQQNRRFTDLTEDPDVWAPRPGAARGVLGD
ncbi:hypothetical protein E1265_28585 [Streptomyces sp. 8K308]|uniref:hypothetical protein n=1 Tax=Streptomyces sp. 8K308 TaxID=2530388 RepID=UPI00104C5B70|nr:hypothetical protein [Streptomyces sp. 8K308]TDC13082.1 hypothetical protein E1265_28585 [Streptomyces sp. 8K308]